MPMELSSFLGPIAGGAIGAVLTYYFKRRGETKAFRFKPNNRIKALSGKWEGSYNQYDYLKNEPYATSLTYSITVGKKNINVFAEFVGKHADKGRVFKHTMTGGFIDSDTIILEYNGDDQAKQFGAVVLKLLGTGKTLVGKLSGYGSESDKIVAGEIILRKCFKTTQILLSIILIIAI